MAYPLPNFNKTAMLEDDPMGGAPEMDDDVYGAAFAMREEKNPLFAEDIPEVSIDMNPYAMDNGVPPTGTMPGMVPGMMGGMGMESMGPPMPSPDMEMGPEPGMEPGMEMGAEMPPGAPMGPEGDQDEVMKQAFQQRLMQQAQASQGFQDNAVAQNQQLAQQRRMRMR